nr:putative uncharacterized protein FLJ46235 [Macaca nemestrina]
MAASWDQVPACVPPSSPNRPSSSCTVACFGPTQASRGLSRGVSSCHSLASLGQGPPSHWPVGAQHITLMASPGPAPACGQPLPHSGPSMDPPFASPWPPQAMLLPFGALCRPSSCLTVASLGHVSLKSASLGPAPASWWLLQAQVILKLASTRPALASRQPLQVHNFLPSASPGSAPHASR